jgi:hypothetical protein
MQRSQESFESVTIVLPVINETHSLKKTVEILLAECAQEISQFVIVVCKKTTPESLAICQQFKDSDPARFLIHHQTLPFLGGAIREAWELGKSSHVVLMASDLETDPTSVKDMIAWAKRRPDAIVTASRWTQSGQFQGYNLLKLLLNKVFQSFFSILYGTKLSDMTFGFRIFPRSVIQKIEWEEVRHPFLFETLIKPLRLGIPVVEVASKWAARDEGESQNTFFRNFDYFRIGFKVRFQSKSEILRRS